MTTKQKKPRLYGAIQVPRECRMPLLEAFDRLAHALGSVEGAEHAPSAEMFARLPGLIDYAIKQAKITRPGYRPSLWLQEKRKGATPLDVIAEEIGIA